MCVICNIKFGNLPYKKKGVKKRQRLGLHELAGDYLCGKWLKTLHKRVPKKEKRKRKSQDDERKKKKKKKVDVKKKKGGGRKREDIEYACHVQDRR